MQTNWTGRSSTNLLPQVSSHRNIRIIHIQSPGVKILNLQKIRADRDIGLVHCVLLFFSQYNIADNLTYLRPKSRAIALVCLLLRFVALASTLFKSLHTGGHSLCSSCSGQGQGEHVQFVFDHRCHATEYIQIIIHAASLKDQRG